MPYVRVSVLYDLRGPVQHEVIVEVPQNALTPIAYQALLTEAAKALAATLGDWPRHAP